MAKPEFSADVIATDTSLLGVGSIYNALVIGVAAQELRIGAAALAGRSSVVVTAHPDNTGYVYIGLDNLVTTAKYFIALPGGSGITVKCDPSGSLKLWAIGSAAGQNVGLLEGKWHSVSVEIMGSVDKNKYVKFKAGTVQTDQFGNFNITGLNFTPKEIIVELSDGSQRKIYLSSSPFGSTLNRWTYSAGSALDTANAWTVSYGTFASKFSGISVATTFSYRAYGW
jgi:hypothetical protein